MNGSNDKKLVMIDGRKKTGLTKAQIKRCQYIWGDIGGNAYCKLVTKNATKHSSKTEYHPDSNVVVLGANAFPGQGIDANSRMSERACLAHELAHVQRAKMNIDRTCKLPDCLIEKAEASADAKFISNLSKRDRDDLIEDARERLGAWLSLTRKKGDEDENRP